MRRGMRIRSGRLFMGCDVSVDGSGEWGGEEVVVVLGVIVSCFRSSNEDTDLYSTCHLSQNTIIDA